MNSHLFLTAREHARRVSSVLLPPVAAPQETPAVASHWPVGATAPTEDAADERARTFAAIAINGKQYKVTAGDVLVIDRIVGAEVGKEMTVADVLLVGSATRTVVGRPMVPGATVSLAVEQQTHAAKDVVFKKRRRKGYKKFNTFRRPITVLRVNDIGYDLAGVDAPTLAAPASTGAESSVSGDRA